MASAVINLVKSSLPQHYRYLSTILKSTSTARISSRANPTSPMHARPWIPPALPYDFPSPSGDLPGDEYPPWYMPPVPGTWPPPPQGPDFPRPPMPSPRKPEIPLLPDPPEIETPPPQIDPPPLNV